MITTISNDQIPAASSTTTPTISDETGANAAEKSLQLRRLLEWFEDHGGAISKLRLLDPGGDMGLSLLTTESISRGDVVMSIPVSLCMTPEKAKRSELAPVLNANPDLMNSPDEVLALYLMYERRKGGSSFWNEYLRTLPDDVDTPLRWIEQKSEEIALLDGTMVGILSAIMRKQVSKDWEEIHLPVIEAHSGLLGGITFQDYMWALSSIWSRAFDYNESCDDGHPSRRRAMVPVINAANHHPSAAISLSEMIEYEMEEDVANQGERDAKAETLEYESGTLRVRAGKDYGKAGEQFFILYGRYSNAKLLYSYGFVLASNPYGGVDYWVKVPPSDPDFSWKQALLDGNSLTAVQSYDFSGTLRSGGWVSPALLATARVAQIIPAEKHAAENAFRGKLVSPRNEAAALGALLVGLQRKLTGPNKSTVDVETKLIASLEYRLQQQQQCRRVSKLDGGVNASSPSRDRPAASMGCATRNEKGAETSLCCSQYDPSTIEKHTSVGQCADSFGEGDFNLVIASHAAQLERGVCKGPVTACDVVDLEMKLKLQRQLAAARVRLEEISVVMQAIAAIEASLRALREASTSAAGLMSFRPLDAAR